MKQQGSLLGLVSDGDKKIPISAREYYAMRLALWRSRVSWGIAEEQAILLVDRAAHMEGCAGKDDETQPCLDDCPDRELRMSALVILNAARQYAPVGATLSDGPYFAPSREYFSQVLAEHAAMKAELEALRGEKPTLPEPQAPSQLPQAPST